MGRYKPSETVRRIRALSQCISDAGVDLRSSDKALPMAGYYIAPDGRLVNCLRDRVRVFDGFAATVDQMVEQWKRIDSLPDGCVPIDVVRAVDIMSAYQ